MGTPEKADLSTILPLIRARLVAQEVLGADIDPTGRIYDTIEDDVTQFPVLGAPQVIWLRLAQEVPQEEGLFNAAETFDARVVRILKVILQTRSLLDKVGDARLFLERSTKSHLSLEVAIYEALQGWHVTDAETDNEYTHQALRYWGIDPPERSPQQRGWGFSVMNFRLYYTRPEIE